MLSVLTLNTGLTQLRLFNRVVWEAVPQCEKRLDKIIVSLQRLSPDIVCLQEVYLPVHRKQIRNKLRTLYPNIIFFPSHGNMILSKYPVARWKNNLFNRMFWFERLYTLMGFVHATIATPLGKIRVANIHTTCGAAWLKWNSVIVRQVQKLQVKQLLAQIGRHRHKIVVCGDFNAGPTANVEVYNIMRKWTDVMGSSLDPTWCTKNPVNKDNYFPDQPSSRIDHIFVSKQFKVVSAKIVMRNGESDHYGVMARLQ